MNDNKEVSYTQDEYFEYWELQKDTLISRSDEMRKIFQSYLSSPTKEMEKQMVQCFVNNDDDILFRSIYEMIEIKAMFKIIMDEKSVGLHSFSNGINQYQDLRSKFMLTRYAMRRIELSLNQNMIDEADCFIIENDISPIAIETLFFDLYCSDTEKIQRHVIELWRKNGNELYASYMERSEV